MLLAEVPRAIHPAEPVPAIWLVAGILLVAVAVALPLALRWISRRRAIPTTPPSMLERQRAAQLATIDEAIAQWRAGSLGAADALQQACDALRSFLSAASGRDLQTRTLSDLRRDAETEPRLFDAVEVIRRSYPTRFAAANPGDDTVDDLLESIRNEVAQWR